MAGTLQRHGVSLRHYVVGLIILFLMLGILGGLFGNAQAENVARDSTYRSATAEASAATYELEGVIGPFVTEVTNESTSAAVRADLANPPRPGALDLSFMDVGAIGHIDLLSATGADVATSLRALDAGYGSAPWFSEARHKLVVSGPFRDPATGQAVAVFAAPIGNTGVFAVLIDASFIGGYLQALYGGPQHFSFVVTTPDGRTAITTSFDRARYDMLPIAGTPFFRDRDQIQRTGLDGKSVIAGVSTIRPYLGWKVFATVPTATAMAAVTAIRGHVVLFILFGLAVALLATLLLYRRILLPLLHLERAVGEAVAAPGEAQAVVPAGPFEVRSLGRGFNALLTAVHDELYERRRAEAVALRSERAYRSLFEANRLPMWVYNVETQEFLAVNAAAEALYGYSSEEFLTMKLADVGADLQFAEHRAAIVANRPLDVMGPYVNRTKSGTAVEVTITSRPIVFDGQRARFVVAEDVSEKQRVQHFVDRARRLESIGELAGGIAHDFNNILGIVSPYTEFVAEAVEPSVVAARADDTAYWEEVRDDIGKIQRAIYRGADLAQRLLAFSGREVSQPEPLDVKSVIDEIAELLGRSLGEHVELVANVAPGTRPILFDPGLLQQVLLNLAVNARYALKDGGTLTIDAEDVFQPNLGRDYVRIRVSDTGIGMTPDTLSRVFEPFFTTKPRDEGTGLGLSSAYGIITGAGGTIDIESEPGQGTTVTITLPPGEHVVPRSSGDDVGPTATIGHGEIVLLVEDDDVLRAAIARILTGNDFEVMEASNGAEALELLRQCEDDEIELLLTDVVMPKMLGRELAAQARRERSGIRVLFISGYAASAFGPANELEEGTVVLKKPFGADDLLTAVSAVLAQPTANAREPFPARPSALFDRRNGNGSANRSNGRDPHEKGIRTPSLGPGSKPMGVLDERVEP